MVSSIVANCSVYFYVITLIKKYFYWNKDRDTLGETKSDSDLVGYNDMNFVNTFLRMNPGNLSISDSANSEYIFVVMIVCIKVMLQLEKQLLRD